MTTTGSSGPRSPWTEPRHQHRRTCYWDHRRAAWTCPRPDLPPATTSEGHATRTGPFARGPRVQVVVAHPDDETFGCGGLLLHARAAGAETAVVCATRGEAGESRVAHADLGLAREGELHRAAAILGVSRVDLLAFEDSGMAGDPGPRSLAGAGESSVVHAILDAVMSFAPDVLVTLDAGDGHRDHERVRDAVLRVADLAGVPRVYLSCLSRSLMRQWCDHRHQVDPGSPYLDVDEMLLGTPDDEITVLVDVRAHRADLERAMAAHASQDSPYAGLPTGLADDFLDTARARRVLPAWRGGPVERGLIEGVAALPD